MGLQRIASWDVVKCVAIFMVVWGHALNAFDASHLHCAQLYRFIYSFHMPLFMMVSGFFSASSFQLGGRIFLKRKVIQLLLPALSWSLITCAYIAVVNNANEYTLFYEFVGNSWFLKTLFACFVCAFMAKMWLKSDVMAFVLSCCIAFVIPRGSFLQFNWLLPFFWAGYFFRKYQETIRSHTNIILMAALSAILTLLYLKNTFNISHTIHIDINALVTQPVALLSSFLWAIAVSLMVILLVHQFCKSENTFVKTMAFVGRYTLAIYVIQTIFLEKFLRKFSLVQTNDQILYNYVYTPIISWLVIVVCVSIARIIERNRYAAMVLLGRNQK